MLARFFLNEMSSVSHIVGVFQIFAGWWRHQPGQPAVGGVPTAHKQHSKFFFEWNEFCQPHCLNSFI